MIPPRIKNVIPNENFELRIEYENGETKTYDITKQLEHEHYKNLRNIAYFMLAKNAEVTIEWPEGEDIDPNELYENSIDI